MPVKGVKVSHGSYLTNFVKGSPPKNGSVSRLAGSLCLLNGVVEDRRFLRVVYRGSYQVVHVQRMVLGFYRPQKDLSWTEI